LALGKELPNAKVTGIDKSLEAVGIAKLNAELLHIKNAKFLQMDIFKDQIKGEYDILISNPPYIPKAEIESLMQDVKEFEPLSALTDLANGLTFYHKISEISPTTVKPNGWLFLEVGLGEHPKKAMKLFSNDRFKNIELIKDYNGDDRVLKTQIV